MVEQRQRFAFNRSDRSESQEPGQTVIEIKNLNVWYGTKHAIADISLALPENSITAIIGPSGCGKSTVLRSINRMTEIDPGVVSTGEIYFEEQNVLDVDPVAVRRVIGMVFQKPNPFPKSIFNNVAFGARINGFKGDIDSLVRECLEKAALWDEVKDDLEKSALHLSGGQRQRLCIARALAVSPRVILMDEPCSALDPVATAKIEDLMQELSREHTILLVTHNIQQASRVSDFTAFMMVDEQDGNSGPGRIVEFSATPQLFTNPEDERTERFIIGTFG